ncbi:ORFL26W [Human betaherpesvirus 5]|nr:ORFL26W [Human betaherpesvirus 5]QHX40319.1 ORFL26W [Human betaherpesvirus 5]
MKDRNRILLCIIFICIMCLICIYFKRRCVLTPSPDKADLRVEFPSLPPCIGIQCAA